MNNNMTEPIGLEVIKDEMKSICKKALFYKRNALKPPCYIIRLKAGNGQTRAVEYIADMLNESGIMPFNELDDYLEFRPGSNMTDLRSMFSQIDNSAVYTNTYEGVIAVDVKELLIHVNEGQFAFFINEMKRLSQRAVIVFFVPTENSRDLDTAILKITRAIDDTKLLCPNEYTVKEMAMITLRALEEKMIETDEKLIPVIERIIKKNHISTVRECIRLSTTLIRCSTIEDDEISLKTEDVRNMFYPKRA